MSDECNVLSIKFILKEYIVWKGVGRTYEFSIKKVDNNDN